jgi:branched-chain amino acid transport system substrate-binding protein
MPAPASAAEANIPVLVPLTGFLSTEGTSQRNGAVLALKSAPPSVKVTYDVEDTGTSPETAVNALERAASDGHATAVAASMLGTQMLAMMPIALQYKVPLITVSGTAAITQQNNPYIFRFFPGDAVVKRAQVAFALEERHVKRPAILYQTDAYGQSGDAEMLKALKQYGIAPVYEDGLDTSVKDMVPTLSKAKAAGADSLLLQLHGASTALLLKAAATMNLGMSIVSGSAISQPSVAALLDPKELAGVCGETGSSPLSAETPDMRKFLADYRKAFNTEPDAFAVGQYDGIAMTLDAVAHGAKTAADVTKALSTMSYKGLAMTYKSNGRGDMAHSAVIICYDGKSRVPQVAKHYEYPGD